MTDKFTPGPWKVSDKSKWVVQYGMSELTTNSKANAALISAAPELLQAAVAAQDLLKVIHDETSKVGMQLQAAIAKARGL